MDLSPPARPGTLPRVAVLIDGDNIPRSDLSMVEDAGTRLGRIALRRVFADIANRKDWACESDYLIIHCTTKNGKNRADMQMTIAALDIAHRGLATAFIIASDDSDFGPLIAHLTEQGFCASRVRKSVPKMPRPEPKPKAESSPEDQVRQKIVQSPEKKVLLSALNGAIGGFRISMTTEGNWRDWLTAKGFLCDPTGPTACVRLAPHSAP